MMAHFFTLRALMEPAAKVHYWRIKQRSRIVDAPGRNKGSRLWPSVQFAPLSPAGRLRRARPSTHARSMYNRPSVWFIRAVCCEIAFKTRYLSRSQSVSSVCVCVFVAAAEAVKQLIIFFHFSIDVISTFCSIMGIRIKEAEAEEILQAPREGGNVCVFSRMGNKRVICAQSAS
jgi:hypothetical protein